MGTIRTATTAMDAPSLDALFTVVSDDSGTSHRLLSRRAFSTGALLCTLPDAVLLSQPSVHSVQVDTAAHLRTDSCLRYLNHSCDPNVRIDTRTRAVLALKPIAPGDELCFFYPSTEWTMTQPFPCWCGAAQCLGTVAGASSLHADTLARYDLNEHIRTLVASTRVE